MVVKAADHEEIRRSIQPTVTNRRFKIFAPKIGAKSTVVLSENQTGSINVQLVEEFDPQVKFKLQNIPTPYDIPNF